MHWTPICKSAKSMSKCEATQNQQFMFCHLWSIYYCLLQPVRTRSKELFFNSPERDFDVGTRTRMALHDLLDNQPTKGEEKRWALDVILKGNTDEGERLPGRRTQWDTDKRRDAMSGIE